MRLVTFKGRALSILAGAILLLVPVGLSASGHKVVKHKVAKQQVRRVPARRTVHRAAKRKVTRRVARRRVRRRVSRRRAPRRPSSSRIEQIQQALARSGYYQGDPTGKWDSGTIDAMKSFQQAHGISPTGKINASSLQKLGLGSDVAGVAPPRPIVPSPPGSVKSSKSVGEGR